MIRIVWAAVIAVGCGLAAGCGETKPAVSQTPNKDALAEVGQMLKSLADEGRKPPAKPAELESVEPMLPTAGPMIREGTLVYLWGTAYAAGGDKVAAYEKKVPAEGGWVLLQNGTVKEMTDDEFKAAPKAK
jgi:hypothetical protein